MATLLVNDFQTSVAAGITDIATVLTVAAAIPGAGATDIVRMRNASTGEIFDVTAGGNSTTWTISRATEDATRWPSAAMSTSDVLEAVPTALGQVGSALVRSGGELRVNSDGSITLAPVASKAVKHSVGGADPLTPPNQYTPITVGLATAGSYAVDGSVGTGNIFHLSSWVENTGTMPVVASFGEAKALGAGSQAWGGNFIGLAENATAKAYGIEIDYGKTVAGGEAYGLVIAAVGENGANRAISIHTGFPNSEPVDGIVFARAGTNEPVSNALITVSNAPTVPLGIDWHGGIFSTAAIRLGNTHGISWRNNADGANIVGIAKTSGDIMTLRNAAVTINTNGYLGVGVASATLPVHAAFNNTNDAAVLAMENLNTGAVTTKTITAIYFGRDTINAQKQVANIQVSPQDSNWQASDLTIATRTGDALAARWRIKGAGHLLAEVDNTYDVGASGATRPRNIYAGTKMFTPALKIGADASSTAGQFARASDANGNVAFEAISFSAGATVLSPASGQTIMVWRAPFACTATNVRSHFKGGTSIVVNARKNQASNHLSSNHTNSTADAWGDGGAVQNTSYAAGDDLEILLVTVNGAVSEATVQVDFSRP